MYIYVLVFLSIPINRTWSTSSKRHPRKEIGSSTPNGPKPSSLAKKGIFFKKKQTPLQKKEINKNK